MLHRTKLNILGAQVANMLLNNGRDGTYYSSHNTKCISLFGIIKLLDNDDNIEEILIPIPHLNTNLDNDNHNALIYDYQFRNSILIR
jgi:hypothetical protein